MRGEGGGGTIGSIQIMQWCGRQRSLEEEVHQAFCYPL